MRERKGGKRRGSPQVAPWATATAGFGDRGRPMGTRVEEEEVLLGVVVKVVEGDGVRVEGEGEGSVEEGCGCRRGWSLVWDCQKWRVAITGVALVEKMEGERGN